MSDGRPREEKPIPAMLTHAVDVAGTRLSVVERGVGTTVVLLHGFPETHRSWDLQIPELVAAGYRTLAVDLRGYGESDRPEHGYDLDTLARDVVAVIDQLAGGRAALVGHDWGGAIAWHVAAHHSRAVTRAVILAGPHPARMARALRQSRAQLAKSWYMFFFQLPRLPERWLSQNDGENLARMFRAGSPGEARVPRELIDAERRALLEPGALRAALAYYRTAFRDNAAALVRGGMDEAYPRIELPVTLLWGEADSCLGLELTQGLGRFAADLDLHVVPGAGHFLHQEAPDVVTPLMLAALAGGELTKS